jgi:hypothetical protein
MSSAVATFVLLVPQARELATLPGLWEAERLPPNPACRLQRERSYETVYQWQLTMALYPDHDLFCYRRLCQARLVSEFWQEACWATMDGATVLTRRKSLRRMKDIIGPDAFYRGEWPWP